MSERNWHERLKLLCKIQPFKNGHEKSMVWGSTPSSSAFRHQPWASCLHLYASAIKLYDLIPVNGRWYHRLVVYPHNGDEHPAYTPRGPVTWSPRCWLLIKDVILLQYSLLVVVGSSDSNSISGQPVTRLGVLSLPAWGHAVQRSKSGHISFHVYIAFLLYYNLICQLKDSL